MMREGGKEEEADKAGTFDLSLSKVVDNSFFW